MKESVKLMSFIVDRITEKMQETCLVDESKAIRDNADRLAANVNFLYIEVLEELIDTLELEGVSR